MLNKYNINVDIVPSSDFSSESLLVEIKKQNIANPKYIIIKGLGGRTHLHDKLSIDNFVYDDVNTYSRNSSSSSSSSSTTSSSNLPGQLEMRTIRNENN